MFGNTWKMTKKYFGSDWWLFHGVSTQTIDKVTFNMLLNDGKSFFRIQKGHKHIYKWGSMSLELCLKNDKKYFLGVTGVDSLMFQTKLLIQLPLICYWMMGNFFLEFKKVTNSLTYEVQWHWNYVW